MKYTLTYTGKEINTAIGNALNLQEALQDKQDKLTAGDGIQIEEDGTITATGSSSVVYKEGVENFPKEGTSGTVYVDTLTNLMYRWDKETSTYVQIGGIGENIILNGGNA